MPSRKFAPTTSAFNVDRMRAEMLGRVRLPADLVQSAINQLRDKVNAKRTEFFTYQGTVVEKVDVEDHATQLSAVDKILSMAGLYAREKDMKAPAPTTMVEVDPITGIVRIVVGGSLDSPPLPLAASAQPILDVEKGASDLSSPAPVALPLTPGEPLEPRAGEVAIIKVRKGTLPTDIHRMLFDEDA